MIANYYTLRHIARLLDQRLKTWRVREGFSQNPNELVLSFEPSAAVAPRHSNQFLVISCEPSENCLFSVESYRRAKKNTITLFPAIENQTIDSIVIHPGDRQITLTIESGQRLVVQLFGSKANVLLVDIHGDVVDAFLRPKEMIGQKLSEREISEPVSDVASFSQQIRELGEVSIGVALKRTFPQFGTVLLTELLYRVGIARSESVDRLSEEELERLFNTGIAMVKELESTCRPRIYYQDANAVQFSITELRHCRQYEIREFNAVDEAIRMYRGTAKGLGHFARERKRILEGLRKEAEHIRHTLTKISSESESSDRPRQYELMGELLKANLNEIRKGMTEAVLENAFDGSKEVISIPLDKNLTPTKNAERYFDKAKKSRVAALEQKQQTTKLNERLLTLTASLDRINAVVSSDELEHAIDEHRHILMTLGLVRSAQKKKTGEEEVPFRVFRVSGDFVVWAGKSGENNDLLSTRYTKPRDLWFHARAVGGSHVVLKFGSGKGEISKHAIGEAAAIAAYYSKMKSSKLVPVSMCEGKYVRKPKGAPAGTVTIEREKVIFVEPRLPGG